MPSPRCPRTMLELFPVQSQDRQMQPRVEHSEVSEQVRQLAWERPLATINWMQVLFKTRTQEKMKIEYVYVGYSFPTSGLGAAADDTRRESEYYWLELVSKPHKTTKKSVGKWGIRDDKLELLRLTNVAATQNRSSYRVVPVCCKRKNEGKKAFLRGNLKLGLSRACKTCFKFPTTADQREHTRKKNHACAHTKQLLNLDLYCFKFHLMRGLKKTTKDSNTEVSPLNQNHRRSRKLPPPPHGRQ
jgi:hypothetical protein